MGDELLYSLIFFLMGLVSVLWSRTSPKSKGDPFLIKSTFIGLAVLCFLVGLYLLIKSFNV